MALSTEAGNKVWQKVKNYLSATAANPASQSAFQDLKAYLAQQKRNPDLQFIPFTAEQCATNLGVDLVGAACTCYGIYAKARRTSATTASWFSTNDAADNSATTATVTTQRINLTGQEFSWVSGFGQAYATGLTVSCANAVGGATESSAALSVDGFVIVGA